jgi:hypothetical protein
VVVVMEEGFRETPSVLAVETHVEEAGHRRTWRGGAIQVSMALWRVVENKL